MPGLVCHLQFLFLGEQTGDLGQEVLLQGVVELELERRAGPAVGVGQPAPVVRREADTPPAAAAALPATRHVQFTAATLCRAHLTPTQTAQQTTSNPLNGHLQCLKLTSI